MRHNYLTNGVHQLLDGSGIFSHERGHAYLIEIVSTPLSEIPDSEKGFI